MVKRNSALSCAIAIVLSATAFSSSANAESNTNQRYAQDKVQNTQQHQTATVKTYSFDDDAIKVALSRTDMIKAKNFGLTDQEYAKYKYLMEYTPRGTWTKNIDPVVALGVSAKTEAERIKYAKLIYKQREIREKQELAFSLAVMKVEQNHTPDNPRWKPWQERRDWILKKTDPNFESDQAHSSKSIEYVNIFVDPSNCKTNTCNAKMHDLVRSKLANTKIEFVLINSDRNETEQFKHGLSNENLSDIRFSSMKEQNLPINHPELPFMYIKNAKGDKLIRLS
ncbi:hypothetical protein [Photobacterium damselae]|uniref:hypothetical protein n=1 Tax=Photobacterium damselae TaxID=38293 RepID=UPI00406845C0